MDGIPVGLVAQLSSLLVFRLSTPIMNGDDGGIFLALRFDNFDFCFCIPRAGSERSQLINIKIATPMFMQTESPDRARKTIKRL
jgi:hypothetical protein